MRSAEGAVYNMEEKRENTLPPEGTNGALAGDAAVVKGRSRNKKGAVILIAVILVALVVVCALAAVDFDAIKDGLFKDTGRTDYYQPVYGENIWENHEYMSHAFAAMKIGVCEDGFFSDEYAFGDADSAEEAFERAGSHQYGAEVLADYFYALLCGCDTPAEKSRFRDLFSVEFQINRGKSELPGGFTCQKIYDLRFDYQGEEIGYDGTTTCQVWLVSYRIVRNDGTVLNYSSGLDHGQARFYVEETAEGYRIKEIVGIYKVN